MDRNTSVKQLLSNDLASLFFLNKDVLIIQWERVLGGVDVLKGFVVFFVFKSLFLGFFLRRPKI